MSALGSISSACGGQFGVCPPRPPLGQVVFGLSMSQNNQFEGAEVSAPQRQHLQISLIDQMSILPSANFLQPHYKWQQMIFDWQGLKEHRYFHLTTVNDPLKYCNYALPIPSPVGLPFMPCDLPNEYELSSTNEDYTQIGDIYLAFQETVPLVLRILLPASHRPWEVVGKDYYQHVPYEGVRETNCCFSEEDRPTVQVRFQERFIGKIVERSILNCCCWAQNYMELQIQDQHGRVIYRIVSKNPQRGHVVILPWWGFDQIRFDIVKMLPSDRTQSAFQEGCQLIQGETVGQIVHLFNGLSEYTSKNDKYGITFPQESSEEEKCLIVYATLLIDYLLFCNF